MHAAVFAGAITCALGAAILYSQYGFWHQKYSSEDDLLVQTSSINSTETMTSPTTALSDFFKEASMRFTAVTDTMSSFLEGKDTYSQDENSTSTKPR